MEKKRFGRTGLMVSRIAFGGIPIERLSVSEAADVVRGVIRLGVNFIDTANGYSDSEEKIGLAIKEFPRDEIVIATKTLARDKKTFNEHLDLSLRRLGTDYIDLYQHHAIPDTASYDAIMSEGGAFEGMMEAIRAGKVRFPGFTSHSITVATQIMRDGKFDAVQLPFNFIDTEAADEAIPLAKKLDMGFIAMKPLGGGRLDNIKLAIKYISSYENIIPDPGIERLSEMEEIIRIVESGEKYTEKDAALTEEIRTELGSKWCHRCDYCQPCPQGIGISAVLTVDSQMKRLPFQRVYAMASQNMKTALECTNCRQCVGRCPYKLEVPDLIKEKLILWDEYVKANSLSSK